MTYEQIGKYIKLLCLQHQMGRLTEKQFFSICDKEDEEIISKFSIAKNGLYYQEKLEKEIKRRKEFTESRRNNGSKGGRPKKANKNLVVFTSKPSENHSITITKDKNIIDNKYYFNGEIIKLNKRDYENWKNLFKNIDLDFHLKKLDMEFVKDTPDNWFVVASSKLGYQNRQQQQKGDDIPW